MDKFFKSLKDNLENQEAPDFNPAAWKKMQEKLVGGTNPPGAAHTFSKWIPLLALLLIGSTALNAWFFLNSNNTNLNSLENSKHTHQIDTILQTNVIYRTDTIYKTAYITVERPIDQSTYNSSNQRKNSVIKLGETNSIFTHHTLFLNNAYQRNFEQSAVNILNFNTSPKSLFGLLSDSYKMESEKDRLGKFDKSGRIEVANFNSITNNTLNTIHSPTRELDIEYVDVRLTKYRKSFGEMITPLRPKAFKLGITSGYQFALENNIETEEGKFIYGIEPSIVFSENLELFGAFSIYKTEFETETMDESIGVPFVEPEDEEATFDGAEVSQDIMQYGIGMKYLFANNTKFTPYVGAGFYGLRTSNYKVQYEFEIEDVSGGQDHEDEEFEISYNNFNLKNQLVLRTGVSWEFLNKWSMDLDAFYRHNLDNSDQYTPNNIGVRTGIYRKF